VKLNILKRWRVLIRGHWKLGRKYLENHVSKRKQRKKKIEIYNVNFEF